MTVLHDQYIRKCRFIVYSDVDNGVDLSEFHITFKTSQDNLEEPNSCIVRVFNLSDRTAQSLMARTPSGPEYNKMILQAGYKDGAFGKIFQGTMREIRRGRVNATDTYLDFFAADGDIPYGFGVANGSLAAGATAAQQLELVRQGFNRVSSGTNVTFGANEALAPILPSPRGKVMFGMGKAYMRDMAATAQFDWGFEDGNLRLVSQKTYLPGEAVVLTSKTGLIGIPEQTQDGIQATCLLNPMIKIGGAVKIDNRDIQAALINIQYTRINNLPSISADGFYKAFVIEHVGDTRGQPWYTNLTCLSIDQSAPIASSVSPYGKPIDPAAT